MEAIITSTVKSDSTDSSLNVAISSAVDPSKAS